MEKYLILSKTYGEINEQAYELIIDKLYELGVEGVEIEAPWTQEELDRIDGDYIDLGIQKDQVVIKAYIREEDYLENEALINRLLGEFQVLEVEEEEKWLLAYQKYFKVMKIGRRFVIVPVWEEYDAGPGELVIHIDPSIAFGTGSHPTTRNVLLLMEEMDFKGKEVADVGSGSGILSYGAALLGAKEILVLDNDEKAMGVASENLKQFGNIRYRTGNLLEGVDECFDIILANIVAGVLVTLSGYLDKNLKAGGHILISGIIAERWEEVLLAMEAQGLTLLKMIEEDGWVSALLQKEDR